MKLTIVGSRYFGAAALEVILKENVEILSVVVLNDEDRLAVAAREAGLPVAVQADPKVVTADMIPEGTDLIVTAHCHARIEADALAKSRLGGIGYHPSLLPRHRGMAAVEWTVKAGDAIAGGTIYHLAERMDAGAIAMQDWRFVKPGEDARSLWERALAPLGLDLMGRVIRYAIEHDSLPSKPQDEEFATAARKKDL
ncbi:Methionyl-tRNA formyltransferase [Hartmannibacter diazotrophicus]|uniref:Methionyl-tRNA formyltransferase n=1 Tax=Hartmannibacter diazotrophicus TaxID=1482074 RepID=A0A2C9DEA9_9HYPH|nr:formyltransferase family protein [Hartmannibacter diazotrophicus]SON58281.1 Methionyl-tRNA formyltransferase [Hartmannibacter diazotrophicus]